MNRTTLILSSLLLTQCVCAHAQDEVEHLRLLTSEPEDDRGATLATTGDDAWMAFSSERDGNSEIYAIPLDKALREAPRLIAPDPASDTSPSLSPDGRWLAWVSDREDALGDIWVAKFPQGSGARQVSKRGERDSEPAWGIDDADNLVLSYKVTQLDGTTSRRGLRAGAWKIIEGYVDPGERPQPPLEFPAAGEGRSGTSRNGSPVYVVPVYADDTDGDGKPGRGDDPSIWVYETASRSWRQMTPPMSELDAPQMVEGRLVFSARVRRNQEVVEGTAPYEVAKVTGAGDGLERARAYRRDRPLEPFHTLGIARQGYVGASESEEGQRALLFAIDLLRDNARPEAALSLMDAAARRCLLYTSDAADEN